MSVRKTPFVAMLALAGGLFVTSAAHAGGVHWSVNINVPGPVYAEPAYYSPPPVYYAPPPPVYYYQQRPAVVVRPPVAVYTPGPPAIVGGSWESHHRHHWREDRRGWDGHHGWESRHDREPDRWHGDHYGRGR